ncbi:amino acid synthesis family protein [Spelaeicoccus albus]|uniref:Amino acid synthesis protein n=1 Tax=Spelaeicoccus albus TaxID=1280376 RepID=A0A7Z0D1U8_9MICO|nr:amino acid synthesis family protein [Spelaeicoccus albus]NYI66957.1 hypothetical protein [Spelaeicoccus albus]
MKHGTNFDDIPILVSGAERRVGIRKIVFQQEEIIAECGLPAAQAARKATAAAVIVNPWRHRDVSKDAGDSLAEATEAIAPTLARALTSRLIDGLGGREAIQAFGKAAIVGVDGEIEHGSALIHTPYFGNLVREFLEGSSIICFADERAGAGTALTVPLWHKTKAATRDFYQTATVRVADGPRPDEIVIVAGASTGPRPRARIGDRTTDGAVTAAILQGDKS